MLDSLRQFSSGFVAKILIGLLVLSFGVWGVSGSILGNNTNTVIQVGETKIDLYDYRFAYENQLAAFSRQLQRRLSREEAEALGLRQNVLSQLVSGAVLDENSRKMGLGISDQNLAKTIAEDPNFADFSGNFSRSSLQATLRQIGMSEDDYIDSRKKAALRNQILEGTASSLDMPQAFANALAMYQNEKRVFDYVVLGAEVLDAKPVPTTDQLEKYYEANKTRYIAPEYRKVTILKLQASDLSKPDEVSQEDIRAAYEARKDALRSPEKRRIEQLVLKDAAEADAVRAKLDGGLSFEKAVEELGKTIADIDLGLLQKSDLPDQNVADAAFAAEINKPTGIIEGLFGPVILRVSEIQPEATTPYEQVKDDIRSEIALQRAGDEVFSTYDQIEDERAAGAILSEAAQKTGLTTRTIVAMDNNGKDIDGKEISGIPNLPALTGEIFRTEPGVEADPVETGTDGYVWFEVEEVIPERQKEFSEVRGEVEKAWVAAETGIGISGVAIDIAEKVRNGADFNTVLAENLPEDSLGEKITFKTSGELNRSARVPDLGSKAIHSGFSSVEDSVLTADAADGGHVVLRVSRIIPSSDTKLPEDIKTELNSAAAQDILSQLVNDLQTRESVNINPNAIEVALSAGQRGF